MTSDATTQARVQLIAALNAAHRARRGVPPTLEPLVRAFARAERDAGVRVEQVLVDLKRMLAELVPADVDLFVLKLVGWAVAGYYHSA